MSYLAIIVLYKRKINTTRQYCKIFLPKFVQKNFAGISQNAELSQEIRAATGINYYCRISIACGIGISGGGIGGLFRPASFIEINRVKARQSGIYILPGSPRGLLNASPMPPRCLPDAFSKKWLKKIGAKFA